MDFIFFYRNQRVQESFTSSLKRRFLRPLRVSLSFVSFLNLSTRFPPVFHSFSITARLALKDESRLEPFAVRFAELYTVPGGLSQGRACKVQFLAARVANTRGKLFSAHGVTWPRRLLAVVHTLRAHVATQLMILSPPSPPSLENYCSDATCRPTLHAGTQIGFLLRAADARLPSIIAITSIRNRLAASWVTHGAEKFTERFWLVHSRRYAGLRRRRVCWACVSVNLNLRE